MYDDEFDVDDQDSFDSGSGYDDGNYDDGDADSGPPSAAEMLADTLAILRDKFDLHMPEHHVTPATFLRDLNIALHSRPGVERTGSSADQLSEGEDDDQYEASGSDVNYGVGRTNQKLSLKRKAQQEERRRLRGVECAAEQLENSKNVL